MEGISANPAKGLCDTLNEVTDEWEVLLPAIHE